MGGPAADLLGYFNTMLEYYLPGLDHTQLSNKEYAQKIAHLEYIRLQELKQTLLKTSVPR